MSDMPYNLPERQPDLVPPFVRALPVDGRGKLAIFDADGTVWRDDVADDSCRWMIDNGHVDTGHRWAEYLRVYREDHGVGCEYMLTFYEGLSLTLFHDLLQTWWKQANRRWIPEVLESLYLLADRGYAIWVVTGSPTDTMLPLLDFLPVHRIVGMDFEIDAEGRITGRLDGMTCTDEGKARKVRHLWGDDPISFAAGNGSLDGAMIALGDQVRWSIYPNPAFEAHSRAQGWEVLPRPADFVEEAKLTP